MMVLTSTEEPAVVYCTNNRVIFICECIMQYSLKVQAGCEGLTLSETRPEQKERAGEQRVYVHLFSFIADQSAICSTMRPRPCRVSQSA
jgi:hypothetical protein